MHTVYKRVLPFVLFPLLTVACGKKSAPVATPAAEPQAQESPQAAVTTASLDGEWEGKGGEDLPITFAVEGDQITYLQANYAGFQNSCSFSGSFGSDGPSAISGKAFTAKGTHDNVSFTATGNFTSMTEASGTLAWKGTSGVCGDFNLDYKWTAKKKPAEAPDEP